MSIEGVDLVGKSTLYDALRDTELRARFVRLPMNERLFPVIQFVDERELHFWKVMYDANELYVCDRSVFVSGVVYNKLYNRPVTDVSEWHDAVRVVHVMVPLKELHHRYKERGDSLFDPCNFERTLELFDRELNNFEVFEVDGTQPIQRSVAQVLSKVNEWRKERRAVIRTV